MERLKYNIEPKENLYFSLKVVFSIVGYALIYYLITLALEIPDKLTFIILLIYILAFIIFLFFRLGLLVGYLKGNSIKINSKQFSDINEILINQSQKLGIKKIPDLYILQSGGIMNAFATRFIGSNYIVIYSDILEEAYDDSFESIEFIIGHELGHIKRNHLIKSLVLFPSFIIPFLNRAYSRACEYTCDNIGARLNPLGARSGILMLASGKKIWRKVNIEEYMAQSSSEAGFWSWFAEKCSTHPKLTKRLIKLKNNRIIDPNLVKPSATKQKDVKSDYSDYMPKF